MRFLLRLWLALGLIALCSGPALAHVGLREASPPRDAVLDRPPERVVLTFSGEVSADFPVIEVMDEAGARVDRGDAARDPQNARLMAASLGPLAPGRYTVTWRALAGDGHTIRGSYQFTVSAAGAGQAPAPAPAGTGVQEPPPQATPAEPEPGGDRPAAAVLAGYWLMLAGLLALAGLGLSQALVVRLAPGERYRRWALAALGAALAGTLLHMTARTAEATGVSLAAALSPVLWGRLLLAQTGWAILGRLGVLLTGLALLPWLWRRWWYTALVGAAGLLTVSLGGHAVTLEPLALSVGLDWLHLLAAALWTGGLLQFAVLLPGLAAPGDLGEMVRRFSPLALVSVALLIVTGFFPAGQHIPSRDALMQTAYGLTFRVKLILMAPLLLLAAANLTQVGPRLRRGEPRAGWLRRLASGEAALMAAVLGAAVLLTSLPPARLALPAPSLDIGGHTKHYGWAVHMEELAVGSQTMDLWLYPHAGEITPQTQVRVLLRHMGEEVAAEGVHLGGERFRFGPLLLAHPGEWELEVTIQGPGLEPDRIRTSFTVP